MQKPPSETPRVRIREESRATLERRAALILILAACLLFGFRLGVLDFWAPDEPRYGSIAEELRSFRHGARGLVLLHLNDAPYTQKPPLYFWLAALAGAPAGEVDELAARLPSAVAAVASVALTALLGCWLLRQPIAALLAAGLLATSFRFAFTARRAQLDPLLTAFELAAITLFLWLELRRGGADCARRHPLAIAGIHAALGAAALVKGPVGWLPLAVFAGYLAWEGRLEAFRAIAPAWAWLLSLGPLALWISAAIALAPPGFAGEAVGENVFGRFFTGTSHARPIYYFAYQLPLDFLPWTLLLPFSLPVVWRWTRSPSLEQHDPTRRASAGRFLLVWILVPLVFFSLSAGKRGLYLLPIFPSLALVAVVAATGLRERGPLDARAAIRLARGLAGLAILELAIFSFGLPLLNDEKSPRPIAEAAASQLDPDETIGVYGMSTIEGGITYYSGHPIASLRNEAQLEEFLSSGGRIVILRARHLDSIGAQLDLVATTQLRSGARKIAVARSTREISSHPRERSRF